MKTTLNIDATVIAQLKREAARQGRTMSELVEVALRNLFRSQKEAAELSPLPTFHSGCAFLDIADRDDLYQTMEGRQRVLLVGTIAELPWLAGNLLHDAHTAVLMREHGIRRICTHDVDFHRFSFLEVVEPP